MRERIYKDRREAGQILGEIVARLPDIADGLVLGLVRGGVPVAYEVARACRLPLDILVVRKLGVPWQQELAMGAIASGGSIVLNEDILRSCQINQQTLDTVLRREKLELDRREALYREGRPEIDATGRAVILVDDGLATGASMRAAIRALRPRARRVIVAVPVGARTTCDDLKSLADEVVCALIPEPLDAVGFFYRNFDPTADDEVRELLRPATETHSDTIHHQAPGPASRNQ